MGGRQSPRGSQKRNIQILKALNRFEYEEYIPCDFE